MTRDKLIELAGHAERWQRRVAFLHSEWALQEAHGTAGVEAGTAWLRAYNTAEEASVAFYDALRQLPDGDL